MCHVDGLAQRVERARVNVPRLQRQDQRPSGDRTKRLLQCLETYAPLLVRGNDHTASLPKPEEAQRNVDRVVALLADDDGHLGGARQSVVLDVPANSAQHVMASRSQAGEVRHHRPGHETDRGSSGQTEQVEQPRPATRSTPAAAGDEARRPAFWSQVEVSQSAARAAGKPPPITQPKNRPDGMATSPARPRR